MSQREDDFFPVEYIERAYPKVPEGSMPFDCIKDKQPERKKFLKSLSDFFTTKIVKPTDLKVLDYGCGPVVLNLASAAPKASELIFAEYAAENRTIIQKWAQDKENRENILSPYIKYVVRTLEGGSEEEAVKRESMLRSKVKAVVECDLTEDQFIAKGYEGPYDVVICSLVVGVAYSDVEGYATGIKKLASLIKKGGYLLLYTTTRKESGRAFYTVNDKKFHFVSLTEETIIAIMEQNGFRDLSYQLIPYNEKLTDWDYDFFFISGNKK